MAMVFDAEEWKGKVSKCNEAILEIKNLLSKGEQLFIEELTRICEDNGLAVESIQGSSDSSVYEIHFKDDTSNSIHFSRQFLNSLNMSFSVQRRIDWDAGSEMYLEIYPLEKG